MNTHSDQTPTIEMPVEEAYTPLESEEGWLPVKPSYTQVLRIQFAIIGAIPTGITWLIYAFADTGAKVPFLLAGIFIPLFFALLLLVVIPRKVRRIRYLVRELDVNFRHGLVWFSSISVAINRVQHAEVSQGPLERIFGLSTLALFTAGGVRSDLKIPGLNLEISQQLKSHFLQKISSEELEDDEL